MKSVSISAEKRVDLGKKAKALRAAGKIPCVVYGGEKILHFTAAKWLLITLFTHRMCIRWRLILSSGKCPYKRR